MNGVKGLSIIYHTKAIKYFGKYVAGIFSDNNYEYRNREKHGWGFKFDLYLAPLIRPIPKFWKKEFIKTEPKIKEVYNSDVFKKTAQRLEEKRNYASKNYEEFSDKEKQRLKGQFPNVNFSEIPEVKNVNDFKYGMYNPWKGEYWFVLRAPKCIPYFFFSISTPWRSIYFGFKTSKIEPFLDRVHTTDQGDYSWCNENEEKLAKELNSDMFRSAVPSCSIRKVRT